MNTTNAVGRPALAVLGVIFGLIAGHAQAGSIEMPFVKARLVQVDVYDRDQGTALPVYWKNGRSYVVGTPGHEYAVRIRNCTNGRVLAVTSVDGVNVISGDTAAASQSGYVLEPWGSVEVAGWRKSWERTAAFYFTDLGDSYAARTGRPRNVGVIGVAVFQENSPPVAVHEGRDLGASGSAPPPSPRPEADTNGIAKRSTVEAAAADALQESKKSLGKLGTGHGRSEESWATSVAFERSTESPLEVVAIQYDRRENLVAMNVIPRPEYARGPQPEPFPAGMRFAPDPRW